MLDIGCGNNRKFKSNKIRGNVNIDVEKPLGKIDNFILCDGHYLPFKGESFTKIFMYDLIEHLKNPWKVLNEAKRVLTKHGNIEIGTPNSLYLPKILRSMIKGT